MTVTLKLFGPQARIAGTREMSLHLAQESPTVGDLRVELIKIKPKLAPSISNSRLAVNFEFADDSRPIGPDDEVALIGMVCGG